MRKIVKKYDKRSGRPPRLGETLARLEASPFCCEHPATLERTIASLEALCPIERLPALRERVRAAATAAAADLHSAQRRANRSLLWGAASVGAGSLAYALPLLAHDEDVHARRCLGVLVSVITLWLSEALPYFVTALLDADGTL